MVLIYGYSLVAFVILTAQAIYHINHSKTNVTLV